jgi:catalase-peroxidase
LKPVVYGFRNLIDPAFDQIVKDTAPERFFLDEAQLMNLSAPEWTVLTEGLRVLGADQEGSSSGAFTDRVGVLSNDFFTSLTDVDLFWRKANETETTFHLKERATYKIKSHAARDGTQRFVKDFVSL